MLKLQSHRRAAKFYSSAFLASLAALRALRRSSANFFFSSLLNFFSNNPSTLSSGKDDDDPASCGLGLVAGGASPIFTESGIWAAIPAAPPVQPSIRLSQKIPSDMTPPTAVFCTVISSPSSFVKVEPTGATASLWEQRKRKR